MSDKFFSLGDLNLGKLLQKHPELRQEHHDYNINVTSNSGTILTPPQLIQEIKDHLRLHQQHQQQQQYQHQQNKIHLYFHIPLCNYICKFCNYVKMLIPKNKDLQSSAILDHWVDLLIEESRRHLLHFPQLREAQVESLYLGGGTAALLNPAQLQRLLQHAKDNYQVDPGCEISLEGNPDNFQGELLDHALNLGFNRFSVGIQSLQDEVLQFTGRKHSAQMAITSIEKLHQTKRPFNADFMFGLPYQTVTSVVENIQRLVDLKTPTITIYRLRNADRENMGIGNKSLWNNKKVREDMENQGLFPSLETTYEMREKIVEILLAHHYFPSPCGWWSRPNTYKGGNIPQVSKNKWQNYDSMVAIGPGAYGWYTGDSSEVIQTHNQTDIKEYSRIIETTKELPFSYGRKLQGATSLASRLGFNFKANQPIVIDHYWRRFGIHLRDDCHVGAVMNQLVEKGLIELSQDKKYFRVTLEGEALHEEIISTYFHKKIGNLDDVICRR